MYNISIPPHRFLFRHLAPADEQSGNSDWGRFVTAARARLRAPVNSTVLVQEERKKEPTRPYMKNETLTRKQNQKTCDLSDSCLQPPWPDPHIRPWAASGMQGCG